MRRSITTNISFFWLVGSGVSPVLFLKGGRVGSHYTAADDCKAVLVVESALATCQVRMHIKLMSVILYIELIHYVWNVMYC